MTSGRGSPIHEEMATSPEQLRACCEHIASWPRFGLDTEFVGEDSYHPHLCLVQVATPERLILIDPLTCGPLDEFWALVTDASRQVIVHAGREEVRLCRYWTGRNPGNIFDLQIAAGLVGRPYPLGHAALVGQLLRVSIAKGETLTEWRNRPLTASQLRYAFDDVRYLLPAWQQLHERLDKLGRLPWAAEEFSGLATSADPTETTIERWRKLRGIGSFDRRRLALVRELYRWREDAAERTNRPARLICRDDLLIEIARRNPSRERDLKVVRGLPHRDLGRILEAVQRGRELPAEQCPAPMDRDQDPPQVTWSAALLSAVLGDLCVRLHLAPGLVANSQDVKQLVRARFQGSPIPNGSPLRRGWRGATILPELQAVLEGRRCIRIADVRAEAPFEIVDSRRDGEGPSE